MEYTFLDAGKQTQMLRQRILELEGRHFEKMLDLRSVRAAGGETNAEQVQISGEIALLEKALGEMKRALAELERDAKAMNGDEKVASKR